MSELRYTLSGDKQRPVILLLHGFMGSAADWRGVTATLNEEFRCIVVDLPGHGASVGLPPETYTFDGAGRAVISALDETGTGRATFAGYSMGGRLALYLSLRYPERCNGLFLESASPGLKSKDERAQRRRADEERALRLETGDFDQFLNDWYRQPLFASLARDRGSLERITETRRSNDPGELARSLQGMGTGSQPSLWAELPALSVPGLAVAGALDEKFVSISNRVVSLAPGMRTVTVPGAGHNVHAEAPGTYTRLLKDFLRSL